MDRQATIEQVIEDYLDSIKGNIYFFERSRPSLDKFKLSLGNKITSPINQLSPTLFKRFVESNREYLSRNGLGRYPTYVLHFYEYVLRKGLHKNDIQSMKAWLSEQRKKYRLAGQKKIKSGNGNKDEQITPSHTIADAISIYKQIHGNDNHAEYFLANLLAAIHSDADLPICRLGLNHIEQYNAYVKRNTAKTRKVYASGAARVFTELKKLGVISLDINKAKELLKQGHEDKALHETLQAELTFAVPESAPSKIAENKAEQLTPTQEYEAKLISTQSQLIEMQNRVIALMQENAALKSNPLQPQIERLGTMSRNGKSDYLVVV